MSDDLEPVNTHASKLEFSAFSSKSLTWINGKETSRRREGKKTNKLSELFSDLWR